MSSAAQVTDLLARVRLVVRELRTLLENEHQRLAARDGAAVELIAGQKRELIERLESLTQEQNRLLTANQLETSGAGFETLLSRLEPRQRATAEEQWAEMKEDLALCHKQNQVNGLLLDSSLRATHAALALLLGHKVGEPTYNSQGTVTPAQLGTRSYAKA